MSKFKVGDTVRVAQTDYDYWNGMDIHYDNYIGKTGKITDIMSVGKIEVSFDSVGFMISLWTEKELELVIE